MVLVCKSCTECLGLQKCSATPDVSERLFILSRRCSSSLSLIRRPVCPCVLAVSYSLRFFVCGC